MVGFSPYVQAEELIITGNGSDSDNQISISSDTNTTVEQSNNADIRSNVQQAADSGNNSASDNSGDASIQTGDINTTTEVSNQANVSTVDIACCSSNPTEATISGNGSDSDNNIEINSSNQTNVSIDQRAEINNDIDVNANTGGNSANRNSGDVSIDSGDIEGRVEIRSKNINIDSVDIESCCKEISIKVADNGSDSDNSIKVNEDNDISVVLDNRADVEDEVDIDADTGNNEAEGNSGDVSIKTGDIDFEAIIENGPMNIKLVRIGPEEEAIITPHEEKEEKEQPAQPPAQPPSQPAAQQAAVSAPQQPAGEVLAAAAEEGEVLPISGDYTILGLTIISALMFLLGLYLRFHPGRDPSIRKIKP
ncbi:MAG: Dentin sialophosphoprotein [Candidatus Daviesbacteria bacterium GW2011_GWA1_41_61]|nr:MAG: seg [Candidatus Daviesbacteria bacterium GW2011_GWC1_40_9]KKR93377.1 MAG: Dentin sialophosphoprotein [Candidatus Daviesbacteria bacterium GW2011_GWB1_41_15]KKS15074.1 MAG: Dentin sialophosphoprotein [Candidatus Daviesbacteria bacterium GW2011_GWA1_41_61]